MIIHVRLYSCFSVRAVMWSFHHAFVSVVVNSIAWPIITLQIIALSHCYLGLVHNVAPPPPLFPESFSAQRRLYATRCFECLCLERVLECMLLNAIKRFVPWAFSLSVTVCLMRVQTRWWKLHNLFLILILHLHLKVINVTRIRESNQGSLNFNIFPTGFGWVMQRMH